MSEKESFLTRLFGGNNRKKEARPDPLRLRKKRRSEFRRREKRKELGAAQEILGIKPLFGYKYNPAVFYPDDGNLETNRNAIEKIDSDKLTAVAYSDLPVYFSEILLYLNDATIMVRSFPLDLSRIVDRFEEAREDSSVAYREYLREYQEWVAPNYSLVEDGRAFLARDVLFWGRADVIIPSDGGKSAGSKYAIPEFNQVGPFLHSILHRQPISFARNSAPPLLYASPSDIIWSPKGMPNAYVVRKRAFTFWKGIFNLEHLPGLLKLDVDILLNIHTETDPKRRNAAGDPIRTTYITPILRSSSEIVDGKTPKFDELDRQLRFLGNWRKVKGADIRLAFQQFVPGSQPIGDLEAGLRWFRRRIDRTRSFSQTLVSTVGKGQELTRHDFVVGHVKDQHGPAKIPVTVDLESRLVATGVVVQTGGGKTTYSVGSLALPRTENILHIQLHRGKGEAAPLWAKRFGGDVFEWDLPDVVGVSDAKKAQEEQLGLMRQDEEDAKAVVRGLVGNWIASGKPVGLPIVIRPQAPTNRFYNKVTAFLSAFSEAWEEAFVYDEDDLLDESLEEKLTRDMAKTAYVCMLIIDDFSKLPGKAEHSTLGKIQTNVGMRSHELMQDIVNSIRKMGMAVIFTTQEEKNFTRYSESFLGSLTLLVRLQLDEKSGQKMATFIDPQRGDVLHENVDVTLSKPILNTVARLEDRR